MEVLGLDTLFFVNRIIILDFKATSSVLAWARGLHAQVQSESLKRLREGLVHVAPLCLALAL